MRLSVCLQHADLYYISFALKIAASRDRVVVSSLGVVLR
jgi:hypothetical protein